MKLTNFQNHAKLKLLSVFALVLLTASCDDRLPEVPIGTGARKEGKVLKTFKIQVAPLTKTAIREDATIKWLTGDQVGIFDSNGGVADKPVYVVNSTVTAEVESSSKNYYSVYPFDASAELDPVKGELKTMLPLVQYPKPGNFDKNANIMYAVSKQGEDVFSYNNACALMKFSISDEEIASLKFEGLAGEVVAGKINIGLAENKSSAVDGKKALRVVSGNDSHEFVKDTSYYFFVAPVELKNGFKMTLTKKNGAVGVYKSAQIVVAAGGEIIDLGKIKCETYKSDLKADFEDKGSIVVGGVEYKIEKMPAYEAADEKLSKVVNGSGKSGIYFLDSDKVYDISDVNITSKVVIVGNDGSKPARIIFGENKPVLLGSGELTLSNVALDNSGRSGYVFGPDKAAGAVNADFERLVIEKSILSNVTRTILYYDLAKYGVGEISLINNKIEMTFTDKPDIQLFNIWKSNPASYKKFTFTNNVYYASGMKDVQIFNGVDKVAKPYSGLDIEINNNIVYNIHSSKSMIKASVVNSLSMAGNIFYVVEKKPNDFFKLYGQHKDSVIDGGSTDSKNTAAKKNFAYALGGNGWTNYAVSSGRIKFFMTNWVDLGTESPFVKADAATGTFELKKKYTKYGPQN